MVGIVAMAGATWAAGRAGERWALADLDRQARSTLTIQAAALHAEIQRQSALPLALASDPEIAALLGAGAPDGLADRVSVRLATIAGATGAAVIYVVRPDGVTLAASNAGAPDSFVGRNYAFRPYFQRALAEGSASQFALGTASGRAGLYLTRRVGEDAGVVVVKVEFSGVEAAWGAAGDLVFATDPRGIALVTSVPAWQFGTLRPLDPEMRARIRDALEFGADPLAPLPLVPAEDGLVRIRRGAEPAQPALMRDAPVAGIDWRIHSLTPVGASVERERNQARLIALLAIGMAWLGAATLAGRQARARDRLAAEAAYRDALETRVAERTGELTTANARLQDEMEERRRAEADRERLGQELAQAGRLAALGQFAASMAHEINQPLAAIRSYADNTGILVQRGRVEDATENVAAIGRLTDRIGALTRDLKRFARRASGRREPVDVAEILRGSLEIVGPRAERDGVALAGPAPSGLAVIGDGPRLEQVLVNLLQNALDAVAGGPDPRVAVEVEAGDGRVAIEVRDNGPGVPDAVRTQIFDPFFTTKSEGLGLGLAICRGIVEECGGTLAVRDEPGGGTVFRLDLVGVAPESAGQEREREGATP